MGISEIIGEVADALANLEIPWMFGDSSASNFYGSADSTYDVIISKLRWSKCGNRQKDVDDARSVLAVQQGNLDVAYIRDWCDRHGTCELLVNLLVEVALQAV